MNTLEEIKDKLSGSITIKALIIGILLLILMLPMEMISSLIGERESLQKAVVDEVGAKWGNAQTVTGPVLSVPFYETIVQGSGSERVKNVAHFLPDSLTITGVMTPQTRYRGIYKVIVYSSDLHISGCFKRPAIPDISGSFSQALWEEATLALGITDLRGIQQAVDVTWEDTGLAVMPGIDHQSLFSSGISAAPVITPDDSAQIYRFHIHLSLDGSSWLHVIPAGRTTDVVLKSSWTNPGFSGAFLPDDRHIDHTGFTARWNVLNYNRNYPQSWVGNAYSLDDSGFGVTLLIPVDQYQKTMRSAKYAVMFIGLTFLTFLLIEVISKQRVHPFQYLLVSLGLMLFYTLLLSLSEQMPFNWAYLISAFSVVALISGYSYSIFKKPSRVLLLFSLLSILYAFLFIVLQLQDYAILMGSIALFTAIGIIMFVTRKINWYGRMYDEKS